MCVCERATERERESVGWSSRNGWTEPSTDREAPASRVRERGRNTGWRFVVFVVALVSYIAPLSLPLRAAAYAAAEACYHRDRLATIEMR